MLWRIDLSPSAKMGLPTLNIGVEILAFCMDGHSYQAHIFNAVVGVNHPMCKDVFLASITQVKA
jgi:hypothetical protein